MKNFKFRGVVWKLRVLLSALSLLFLLPNLIQAQISAPEIFQKKVKFQQRTDRYVTLFDDDDLSELSVLDKMKLTQSTESCTVENYYLTDGDLTSITTFHPNGESQSSWLPFVKYAVLQDGHSKLYGEEGQLLIDMEMGEKFANMGKLAAVTNEEGGHFVFPTISDYMIFAEPYLDVGFSVSEISQNKSWISGNGLEMEIDFENKGFTYYFRGVEGSIESINTVYFKSLPTGEDVPAYSETVEYGNFPCGVCFQKMTVERFTGYEVEEEVQNRSSTRQTNKTQEIYLQNNPIGDRLIVQGLENQSVNYDFQIHSLDGGVTSHSGTTFTATEGIDVSKLGSGVYFLTIVLPDGLKTLKFVKL